MWFTKPVRRRPHRRRTPTEPPPRQHNANRNQRPIQLRLVHVTDGTLRIARLGKQHIRNPAIRHEVLVHRHLQVLNLSIRAEDLAEVRRVDVLGEFFDDDFGAAGDVG